MVREFVGRTGQGFKECRNCDAWNRTAEVLASVARKLAGPRPARTQTSTEPAPQGSCGAATRPTAHPWQPHASPHPTPKRQPGTPPHQFVLLRQSSGDEPSNHPSGSSQVGLAQRRRKLGLRLGAADTASHGGTASAKWTGSGPRMAAPAPGSPTSATGTAWSGRRDSGPQPSHRLMAPPRREMASRAAPRSTEASSQPCHRLVAALPRHCQDLGATPFSHRCQWPCAGAALAQGFRWFELLDKGLGEA